MCVWLVRRREEEVEGEKKKQRGKRESRVCPRPPVGSALVPLCQQVRTLLRYEERVEPKEETALRVRTKIGR